MIDLLGRSKKLITKSEKLRQIFAHKAENCKFIAWNEPGFKLQGRIRIDQCGCTRLREAGERRLRKEKFIHGKIDTGN